MGIAQSRKNGCSTYFAKVNAIIALVEGLKIINLSFNHENIFL